jgi:hypothetical protein
VTFVLDLKEVINLGRKESILPIISDGKELRIAEADGSDGWPE